MNKRTIAVLIVLFLSLFGFLIEFVYAECRIIPYFSPQDKIEQVIIDKIIHSKQSIDCSLYNITNHRIANAMINKQSSGTKIVIGLDKLQSRAPYSKHNQLINAGIEVLVKKSSILEHNKFCVFDNIDVIMGSYNFSNGAKYQDNSMVLFENCPDITLEFKSTFNEIIYRDRR